MNPREARNVVLSRPLAKLSGRGAEAINGLLMRAGLLRLLADDLEERCYGHAAQTWRLVAAELEQIAAELVRPSPPLSAAGTHSDGKKGD